MGQYIHATKPAGVSNACEVSNGGGKLEGREGGKGRMREANARGIYASKRKKILKFCNPIKTYMMTMKTLTRLNRKVMDSNEK